MADIQTRRVAFPGSLGLQLDGRLEMPGSTPVAFALFGHCFTCNKDYLAPRRISRALVRYGIAVLRFDFTGLGNSAGDFANTNFSTNVADMVEAANFLRACYQAPSMLIGHSLGGAAALMAAARIPESAAVAAIAAPSDPAHIRAHFADKVPCIERYGDTEVELAGRSFLIRRQFLDDLANHDMTQALQGLERALLILHSPRDTVVEIDHAQRIFAAALHPKSFVSLDNADHLVTGQEDAAYIARLINAWASRYIGSASSLNSSNV